MRRRLIVVAAAISLMVTVAFLAPLIVLVRTVARDRAISDAERDAAEMTTALAVSSDEGLITIAATRTDAGRDHRLTVILPSGREIGPSAPRDQDLTLAEGGLAQRVEPDGPKEVAAVGQAFNVLADRVGVLLTVERELVADLSHSLRTPLTVLRFEADAITDPAMRDRVRSAVVELEDA